MKHLFIIITTIFSLHALAKNTEDLSQMLKDNNCIPVLGKDGNVSTYKCDGPLGEKMKQGHVDTTANGEVVGSSAKAMELYNSMKANNTMAVQRPASLTDKIKACLAGVYSSQISFHKAKGTYTPANDEFGLNRISTCKGLDVSADYANQSGFKFVAKAGDKVWSVDESKTMTEIQ